ncbi:hypothetical protein BDR04DRAFT_1129264 [Suillus decipiens]|nr:hypothetical protein BDR04DRAFT_1129264 [Suillus decipiens]
MHIAAINTGDLLLPLWRETFRAKTTDDKSMWAWAVLMKVTWKAYGSLITDATPFLQEKINSGYKAWEWLLYMYGMALATLYGILPEPYWLHFFHLAWGLHLMQQHHISRSDLVKGHHHLLNFTDEFEELYYQHQIDQLHFAIIPMIKPSLNTPPKGSLDLVQGYILLFHPCKSDTIIQYLASNGIHIATAPPITRWAHLCLPNGQENVMSKQPRMAQNMKVIYFYFNMMIHDQQKTFMLVSQFSQPHPALLEQSFQMVFPCHDNTDNSLRLIEVLLRLGWAH